MQHIKYKLTLFKHRFEAEWMHVKDWRGFGVLALLYIALWSYVLVALYLPWQEQVMLEGVSDGWNLFFPQNLFNGFVIFGLVILPGAFYVAWANLLRGYFK